MEVTEQDIAYLQANPEMAPKFEERFGAGTSAQYLTPSPEVLVDTPEAAIVEAPVAKEEGASFSDALSRRPGMRNFSDVEGQDILGQAGTAVRDITAGAANGVEEAINETVEFLGDVGNTVLSSPDLVAGGIARMVGDDAAADAFARSYEYSTQEVEIPDIDLVKEPVTSLGRFTSTTTQFFAGFLGAGKVTGLKGFVGSMVNGAISDGLVMNPDNPNLSTFLEANEYGPEWLTTALATDPDDPEWLNRMRNVTEGAALGGMIETVFLGFRAVAKAARVSEVPEGAAREAAIREAEELAEIASDAAEQALREGAPAVGSPSGFKTVAELIEEARVRREGGDPAPVRDRMTASQPQREGPPTEVREGPEALVSDETLAAVLRAPEPVTPQQLANSDWFNASRMEGPIEAQRMIDIAGAALDRAGAMERLGITPQTLDGIRADAVEELAGMVGAGGDALVRRLASLSEDAGAQTRFLVAGKMALQSIGREAAAVARRLNDGYAIGKVDPSLEGQLLNLMRTHADVQGHVKSIQTNAARTTTAGRIETGDALNSAEVAALRQVEQVGGSEAVRKLAQQVRLAEGPNQLARVIRSGVEKSGLSRAWDVVNEVFINNILSGYPTHMVNMASNAINVAYLPFERMVGGALTRNGDQVRAAMSQYAHLRSATVDSVRMMGRVLRTETPVLDTQIKVDIQAQGMKAITRENMGVSNAIGGALIDGVGSFLRLPGRALMAEDEFFKQMTFRSRLNADLSVAARTMTEAELSGMGYASRGEFIQGEVEAAILSTQRVDDLFADLVAKGRVADTPEARQQFIAANQGAANEGSRYAQDALRAAREATFTTPLQQGTISAAYQGMANRHPYLRQITPFIQTPVNILNKAFDRIPGVNMLRTRYRDRLKSDNPAIRAEAAGEMATGVAVSTSLYMLALEGRITGGGPVDGGTREMWARDKGWQPYSLNIGTTEEPQWVEYRRMDPYSFSFGIAGDIAEMIQASEDDPSMDTSGLFAMLVASVGNNLVNKTWLQGVSDAVEVLSSKDRPYVVQNWMENRVASFVPFSAAGRSFNQAVNPYMTEARGYVDRIKGNIPGMSDELATRYDWVSGESVENPTRLLGFLRTSQGEGNALDAEMRNLNYDFTGPDRKIGQIELSSEQFQEWNRLMGTFRTPEGETLSDVLTRVMGSDAYDVNRERVPDGITSPSESHRVKMFARIITRFKQASRRALFASDPELYDAWRAAEKFRKNAQNGNVEEGVRENLITRF